MHSIGVVIPFYQRDKGILLKSLKSIIEQESLSKITYYVVIVDDCSPLSLSEELALLPTLPKNIHLIVFYLWMAGAFLAIALPIFAKYGVQYYIYGKGYSYCREAEYEGNVRQVSLFYTRDRESCIRVALKESLRFRRDAIEYLEEKKKKEL